MNFSLEIHDPFRLLFSCDPGCESAVSHATLPADGPGGPLQPPGVPLVRVRVLRDPTSGRPVLRLSCELPPCSPHAPTPESLPGVSAIDIDSGQDDTSGQCKSDPDCADSAAADPAEPTDPNYSSQPADPAAEISSDEEPLVAVSSVSVSQQPPRGDSSALEEFVSTERTYVRRLGLLLDLYYPGLIAAVQARQLGCCSTDELKQIFGHFHGMRLMHEQLLSDVVQSGRLGKLMMQYGHQLKSYGAYFSMFQQGTAAVRGWMTDEAFRSVFGQLRLQCQDPVECQLDLRALLLEPVQRPMRYPMLLDKYLAEIGLDHPDCECARRAAEVVRDALLELEKCLRDFAAFQERLQLLRSVAFPAGLTALWEEVAHSCLRHGRARQGDKQRYLLLSKRSLIICSPAARFRQEAWAAKRALPVPGELRVLGCEGNLLRMDTPSDPQLHLTFGEPEEVDDSAGSRDGVRECRDWAMELRKLGVPFVDSPGEADDNLMPWERAAGRTGRPVMTPLDKATRCQACGAAYRPLQRRRLSCRVCGGAFCTDCTDYQSRTSWAGDRPLRCCLFCRVATGATAAELLSERHRGLLARFRAVRDMDANPDTLAGPLAAWLSGRWVSVWCRLESRTGQLSLYRHRRDFLPLLAVETPRLTAGAGPELLVHDHDRKRDGCRLRADGGGEAAAAGFLERLALRLRSCEAPSADCAAGADSADGAEEGEGACEGAGARTPPESRQAEQEVERRRHQQHPGLELPAPLGDRPLTPIDGEEPLELPKKL